MSAPRHALLVDAVDKTFGANQVLDGFSMTVDPGKAVVLRGPNGAGKSTLLSCIAGALVVDRGCIHIGGVDLLASPILARRGLRYLPQEAPTPAGISGHELLALHATVFDDAGNRAAMDRAVKATGLGDALERLASTYSVGMRRRLAFGALLFGQPAVFVLDEPFAGVDAPARARLLEALADAMRQGAAVILAAHDRDAPEIEALGAQTLTMGERPSTVGPELST